MRRLQIIFIVAVSCFLAACNTDEADDSEEYVLYSIELDSDQDGETMNFFINDEEVDVEVIYSDDEELSS
ncbi:hypothetical protein [Salinicoccus sp. RF5]|uniref:hypothetical protein n=1 Tax=Salinicoccus sp. RF5 TaxID=2748874 RepID=UPI001E2A9B32|nr:hypothetical protein [Salinicoccus sp. RF5]MCC4721854.1 hypothetical protein [Salinicoccus sp. RF5]